MLLADIVQLRIAYPEYSQVRLRHEAREPVRVDLCSGEYGEYGDTVILLDIRKSAACEALYLSVTPIGPPICGYLWRNSQRIRPASTDMMRGGAQFGWWLAGEISVCRTLGWSRDVKRITSTDCYAVDALRDSTSRNNWRVAAGT